MSEATDSYHFILDSEWNEKAIGLIMILFFL